MPLATQNPRSSCATHEPVMIFEHLPLDLTGGQLHAPPDPKYLALQGLRYSYARLGGGIQLTWSRRTGVNIAGC